MLNVEMDDGWNSDDEEEEEKKKEEKEGEEKEEEVKEEEPKVPLSKKERQKLYHLKVGEKERDDA